MKHPRKGESEARDAELEQLKLKRRRESRNFSKKVDEVPLSLNELISEVQRVAMAGVMPLPYQYDMARSTTYPDAAGLCDRLHMEWEEVAETANLRVLRRESQ